MVMALTWPAAAWCEQPAAPPADPAYAHRERAYAAVARRDYDAAISAFERAVAADPRASTTRKDFAYALLRAGESEAALDQLAEVTRLDPEDHHAALEYAFLCFETGREREARRVFDRLRRAADPASRAAAERAFSQIDRELERGIARWAEAIGKDPQNFSAHRELARLAERRDEVEAAARHYFEAWKIRPARRDLLIDYARVCRELARDEDAMAALIAASRDSSTRTSERARELLPDRYPFGPEFVRALELDPGNSALRREYAYLLLELGRRDEAESQFSRLAAQDPGDLLAAAQLGLLRLERGDREAAMPLLRRVMDSGDAVLADRVRRALAMPGQPPSAGPAKDPAADPRIMARKSLEAGYLQDALRYLRLAHAGDPADFSVMLDLGRAYNMLHRDEEAVRWFDLARRSPQADIAGEAERSYRNLEAPQRPIRHIFWVMPFYSSRWRDTFGYAQWKTEARLGRWPLRPYVSVRFAGDARRTAGSVAPQYLSESSFVFGVGFRTLVWKGLMGWAEAGSDVSYLDRDDRPNRMAPDYRGGVSFARGFGRLLGGEAPGFFFETAANGVYMSRFQHSVLGYSQNRWGFTAPLASRLGGLETQLGWNANLAADARRQDWANFVETGPGLRLRWNWMPRSMVFTVDLLRGFYLLKNNPRGPRYTDIRAGIWYAFSK